MDRRKEDLPSLLEVSWRRPWIPILAALVFAAIAAAVVLLAPERYNATAVLVVQDPRASQLFETAGLQSPDRYVQDQVAILQSTSVADRAIQIAVEKDSRASLAIDELIDHAEIGSNRSSNVIEVVYTDSDPDRSLTIANSIAEAYQEVRRTEAVASFVRAIEELNESISSLDLEIAEGLVSIEQLRYGDPARSQLLDQYEAALLRLVSLQEEISEDTSTGQLDVLRGQLDDVLQQIQTFQSVLNLDVDRPDLFALLNEQVELTSRRSDLVARRAQLEVDAQLASAVALYFPATATEPAGLSLSIAVIGGAVAGLLVGIALVYLLAGRSQTIHSRLAAQEVLSAPLLAEIPDFNEERLKTEVPVYAAPRSVAAESFRFAAAALELRARERKDVASSISGESSGLNQRTSNVVVVVSAEEGDGKSIVVANTALASCWTGNRVLVIDADFGSQTQAGLFMQPDVSHHGLAEVIAGEVPLPKAVRTIELNSEMRLDLLTRGRIPLSATDLLRSAEADDFFATVADNYDLVLIDSPPLLRVAYSSILCRHADRVVVVVSHGSELPTLEILNDRLRLVGTETTGYVYNRAPLEPDLGSYGGSLQDLVGSGAQDVNPDHQPRHRR